MFRGPYLAASASPPDGVRPAVLMADGEAPGAGTKPGVGNAPGPPYGFGGTPGTGNAAGVGRPLSLTLSSTSEPALRILTLLSFTLISRTSISPCFSCSARPLRYCGFVFFPGWAGIINHAFLPLELEVMPVNFTLTGTTGLVGIGLTTCGGGFNPNALRSMIA